MYVHIPMCATLIIHMLTDLQDLHMLHTDPKYQRRGAASILMKQGLGKADELGLLSYLESSPDSPHFYQKHGFTSIEEFAFDLGNFGGGEGVHVTPIMTREPQRRA